MLEVVVEFKYLDRVLENSDSDWPALYKKPRKGKGVLGCFVKILEG